MWLRTMASHLGKFEWLKLQQPGAGVTKSMFSENVHHKGYNLGNDMFYGVIINYPL